MRKPLLAALMIALLIMTLLAGCAASAAEQPFIPTQASGAAPSPTLPERITAEAAEDIALAHAGISREDLSYLRTEFDYDRGIAEYEIEFYHDGWEYDYEIQAVTGEILKAKAEPPKPQRLTKEEAISIALADAGLGQDQVTGLRVEFDYDGGVPEYEVDFRHGGYEYDYEIHAETGAIRSRDKDRED